MMIMERGQRHLMNLHISNGSGDSGPYGPQASATCSIYL